MKGEPTIQEYEILGERLFYYLEIVNKVKNRNNVIDSILEDKKPVVEYLQDKYHVNKNKNLLLTEDLRKAVFKKGNRFLQTAKNRVNNVDNTDYTEKYLKPRDFIKLMENADPSEFPNATEFRRNIKKRDQEIKVQNKIKEIRNKYYKCIDAYIAPKDFRSWLNCPNCGVKPLVWEFNNGRSTACGCGESEYNHFSIHAESIMSVVKRFNGSATEYNRHELRDNWNHWVQTGEILYDHEKEREKGKW